MTTEVQLPRRFGSYVLTAHLADDALGMVFRAVRVSGERAFVRLRILETGELSEDAILDTIEEFGEIHTFLKNPAITRGVVMDSVDGVPFIAWNEESGRTLDVVIARTRSMSKRIPIEHALLVTEKVATALDHAYNTTVDGERTLHGLVWPGFVSISDDGETRLTGFGLAHGVLSSLGQPRLGAEIAPYLAPEERSSGHVSRNADVYAVGAILFELLTGRLPSTTDPLGDLRAAVKDSSAPLAPELSVILRTCLCPTETRYQSSGELRRELGKLLFSGPYAPSTFNLAFFLSSLFAVEMEAENRGRAAEASLDPGSIPELTISLPRGGPASPAPPRPAAQAPTAHPPARRPAGSDRPGRRGPLPLVIGLLAAAAIAGGIWVVTQRVATPPPSPIVTPRPSPPPPPTPTAEPTPPSTTTMSEAQFQSEVARRVAQEVKRLEQAYKSKSAKTSAPEVATAPAAAGTAPARAEPPPAASGGSAEGVPATPVPTASPAAARATPLPEPTEGPARSAASAPSELVDTPPKIQSVVKPVYPSFALRARVKGIVILRVLVGETGTPLDIEVLKGVSGGLTEAAVDAVRRWKFIPGRHNGVPVRAWTTVPIPFEP